MVKGSEETIQGKFCRGIGCHEGTGHFTCGASVLLELAYPSQLCQFCNIKNVMPCLKNEATELMYTTAYLR